MKKRALAMIFALVFVLAGCSESKKTDNPVQENENTQEEQVGNPGAISGKQEEGSGGESENTAAETVPSVEEADKENFTTKMNSAELREINLFLSNFSEAFYNPNSDYYGSKDEALIDFAYTHALINYDNMTFYEDGMTGISAANVDKLLTRFFGKTVPHKTPANNRQWVYSDGKFLMQAASGDSYGDFTIVTEVNVNENGLYEAKFNIYNDPNVCGGDIITDKSIYSLTDSQAAERFDYNCSGTAVLKPKKVNGEETYELVSYSVSGY